MTFFLFVIVSVVASVLTLVVLGLILVGGSVVLRCGRVSPWSQGVSLLAIVALVGLVSYEVARTRAPLPEVHPLLAKSTSVQTNDALPPGWVGKSGWDVNGTATETTVHSGRFATVDEAEAALVGKLAERAIQYMLAQGLLPEPPPPGEVNRILAVNETERLVIGVYRESLYLESVDAEVFEVHARLRFDEPRRQLLAARGRSYAGRQRADALGLAVAGGLGTLAVIWSVLALSGGIRRTASFPQPSPPE